MINYGVRYEVDTHPLDNDLDKPALVAPLLPNGTAPTPIDKNNVRRTPGSRGIRGRTARPRSAPAPASTTPCASAISSRTSARSIAPFNSGNDTITLTAGSATGGPQDFNRDGVA